MTLEKYIIFLGNSFQHQPHTPLCHFFHGNKSQMVQCGYCQASVYRMAATLLFIYLYLALFHKNNSLQKLGTWDFFAPFSPKTNFEDISQTLVNQLFRPLETMYVFKMFAYRFSTGTVSKSMSSPNNKRTMAVVNQRIGIRPAVIQGKRRRVAGVFPCFYWFSPRAVAVTWSLYRGGSHSGWGLYWHVFKGGIDQTFFGKWFSDACQSPLSFPCVGRSGSPSNSGVSIWCKWSPRIFPPPSSPLNVATSGA